MTNAEEVKQHLSKSGFAQRFASMFCSGQVDVKFVDDKTISVLIHDLIEGHFLHIIARLDDCEIIPWDIDRVPKKNNLG